MYYHDFKGIKLSALGFGTMRLPLSNPEDPSSIDLIRFQQMVDLYMARGFCYFDTAYPYHEGLSEEAVRRCVVEKYPRESFLLADKMPILQVKAPEDYERFFAEQRIFLIKQYMIALRVYIRQFIFFQSVEETVMAGTVDFAGAGALETGMFRKSSDHRDLLILRKRQHAFVLQ